MNSEHLTKDFKETLRELRVIDPLSGSAMGPQKPGMLKQPTACSKDRADRIKELKARRGTLQLDGRPPCRLGSAGADHAAQEAAWSDVSAAWIRNMHGTGHHECRLGGMLLEQPCGV